MATLTVNPTVNGDVYRYENTWPLTGGAAAAVGGTRYGYGVGYNGSVYYTYNMVFRFDTSALTSAATISSAKVRIYWRNKSLQAGTHLCKGEYYDPGASVDVTDPTITASETAWTGVDANNFAPGGVAGYYEFTLLNPDSNISKTGYTGFRTHATFSGTPSSNSLCEIDLVADSNKPELVITYTTPTAVPITMGLSVTLGGTINTDRDRNLSMGVQATLGYPGNLIADNFVVTPAGGPLGGVSALSGLSGLFGGGGAGTTTGDVTAVFAISYPDGYRYGSLTGAAWPPASFTEGANIVVGYSYDGGTYGIQNAFLRWDTSSIPDGATITGASIRLYPIDVINDFGVDLHAEYYDWGGGAAVSGDMAFTPSASAGSIAWSGAAVFTYSTLTLTDLTGINKSGYTGIRLLFDAGSAPAVGDDYGQLDFADAHPLQLIVTYTY